MNRAIEEGAKKLPAAYASNVKMSYQLNKDGNIPMTEAVGSTGNLELSFDIDVSGLKAGDKVHILNLVVNSESDAWNKNCDFMLFDGGKPVTLNGETVGYLHTSNWGFNQNGGDQDSNEITDQNHRDIHEMYFVLTKDVKGVGKQHFNLISADNSNSSINFQVGPGVFNGLQTLHATINAVDHDGNVIDSKHLTFTRPTQKDPVSYDNSFVVANDVNAAGNGSDYSTSFEAHSILFSKNELANQQNINSNIITSYRPNSYQFAGSISADANCLDNIATGGGVQVDTMIPLFDSNGHLVANATTLGPQNKNENKVPLIRVEDELSENELAKRLDPNKSECLVSKISPNKINVAYNITADWYKQRIKQYANKASLMNLYNSWQLDMDSNTDQAINNTLHFIEQNDYRPLATTLWTPVIGPYLDVTEEHTIHGDFHTVNAPNGYDGSAQADSVSPVIVSLKQGQSGIKVHYIDGSTGKDLKVIDTAINDAGKITTIKPQNNILGYQLSTENAKGIPNGVQTIETDTDIQYPTEGTWKDVYIVYMPYSTGHTEAHYHYNTIIVSTSHYKKFYTSKTVLFTTKCYRNSKTIQR